MLSLKDIPAARANGRAITLNDLLYTLKITDRLGMLRSVIDDVFILDAVEANRITASVAELQGESDSVRQSLGLLRAADTHAWLKAREMSVDDFEAYIWRRVTARKLKDLLTNSKVQDIFTKRRPDFDRAKIWQIVTENESMAREAMAKLEEGIDFSTVASEYSIDPLTQGRGGYVGYVRRLEMNPAIASSVFLANSGDIIGPIHSPDGYYVIGIDEISRASLNEETTEAIRDMVFREWLNEQAVLAKVEFSLPSLVTR
jgi:parvulin-like peptidyl-prolyl isomerase